jgi:hypothetical protein
MFRPVGLSLIAALSALGQGLIVQRTGGALQFSPATGLNINSKDRALTLGDKPVASGPINKLGNTKLGGTLILDTSSGVVAHYTPGAAPVYLYPSGLSKKDAPQPPEAWKESVVTYKKSEKDKTAVTLPMAEFVAYLPGGVKELADVCMDEAALKLIGGPAGVFPAQIDLTAAAVTSLGSNSAMASVDRKIVEFMRLRQERFDSGIDSAKSLSEGLRFAELSAKAYPDQPDHKKVREQLAASQVWLDRRIAVLRALAAGGQWDAFVLAYREFEKHQGSYPDLAKKHREALQASLEQHWKSGKERLGRGEYRRAWGELRLASARQPSHAVLTRDVAVAWAQYSRHTAVDRQNKRRQLSAGELDVIEQTRTIAERYRQQNKLEEAMKKIAEAETIDPESLPVLLTKASVLGARAETVKALRTLDAYDMLAVDKERDLGNKLRSELTFQLTDTRESIRKKLAEAWNAGRFHQTYQLAEQGLLADDADPTILYYAGLSAMATRNAKSGPAYLRKYLEVSNTLDADSAQRVAVARLLTEAGAPAAPREPEGEAHWFSGRKLPKTVFYCPASLMFTPRVDHIEASNKLSVKFNWDGDRLKSIIPTFEKAQQATGEKTVFFSYAESVPHAFAVESAEAPRKAPEDPDALLKESNVILPNNPLVDAAAVERLTGKHVAVGVAGNKYFNPFVWERPYYFSFEYDSQGRLRSARQLAERSPVLAEFEWQDLRLASVKVYQLADPSAARGPLVYERTMQYAQDRLISEEFRAGQKDGKIKYVWSNTGTLVSAGCEKDETLDNRSREVFFVTAGTRGRAR